MSGAQLRAILWLRWRLTRNQWAKNGGLGAAVAVLSGMGGAALAVIGLTGGLAGGYLALHGASPQAVMWTWLGVSLAFLYFWTIATLVDLQRSEAIDLARLLHLPVSLGWAFAINYLASLMGISIAFFAPAMLGLSLGLALDRGPAMLLLVPLSMGLLLMVTAWTYLLQGWLATWVKSPRLRRALVMAIGLSMALLAQAPNLVIHVLLRPTPEEVAREGPGRSSFPCGDQTCTADQYCLEACCTPDRQVRRRYSPADGDDLAACAPCKGERPGCNGSKEMVEAEREKRAKARKVQRFADRVVLAEKILPPLWLAAGAEGLAAGDPLIALLGASGFGLLGALALLRGYRSTLRFYTKGDGSARAPEARTTVASAPGKRRLVERRIAGVHEQTAAVAVATLRSLLRAPEIMMGLGFSLAMLVVMLAMLSVMLGGVVTIGAHLGPLVVAGAMSFATLSLSQVYNNHFGHDRDGFRALLLSPVDRRRLLLGKNLAALLLGAIPCSAALVGSALWRRLPPLATAAAAFQLVTMLLIAATAGNLLSILLPYRVQPGSMRATKLPPGAMLAMFGSLFGLPILYAPAFAGPLAVLVGHYARWRHPVLADLAISLVAAAAAAGGYAASLAPLGRLLERRGTTIVARVTADQE